MIDKNKKNNRKFVPLSIAESLRSVNKKFLYKFGKLDYTIHAKWSDIVGDFFVKHSEPQKITSIPNKTNDVGDIIYDRYLHVNVSPPAAIEFQHFQDKIIEKINSFFGYKAIKGIKIKQHYINNEGLGKIKKSVNLIGNKENRKIVKNSIPSILDKELEESIVKLGLSITNENK